MLKSAKEDLRADAVISLLFSLSETEFQTKVQQIEENRLFRFHTESEDNYYGRSSTVRWQKH